MNYEMKIKEKSREDLERIVLDTEIPNEGKSFEEALGSKVIADTEERLNTDSRYVQAIENPMTGNCTVEYLKSTKLVGSDRYRAIQAVSKQAGNSVEDISFDEFNEILAGKGLNKLNGQRIVNASIAYEEYRKKNITSGQIYEYLRNKLSNAIRGDYLSYLWQYFNRSVRFV